MSYANQAGKDFDNHVAGSLNQFFEEDERFEGRQWSAHSLRGSGNVGWDEADVLLRTPALDYALELKRTSQDRAYVLDGEDLRQLSAVRNDYTEVGFGVKMTNRELLFVTLTEPYYDQMKHVSNIIPECFDPHVTDGGRLRITKPSTDEWGSAQSGEEPHEVILRHLGIIPE